MSNPEETRPDPSPEAASQNPLSTEGVQEAQSGATTEEAKEAADKLAAEQAGGAIDENYRATAEASQQDFFAELVKRERAAVRAFAVFLDMLPGSVHLDGNAEKARLDAINAALLLDVTLAVGEKMMAAARG